VSTISRAVSRAVFTFGFGLGRMFSPFLTIRIVFFSDIACISGLALISYFPINEIAAILFPNSSKLERWSLKILQRRGHIC
jgi:hypothetical protein